MKARQQRGLFIFWGEKLRYQSFVNRIKYFSCIFWHGSIKLVELYQNVYIKNSLNRILGLKLSRNCLKNVLKHSHFLHLLQEKMVFSYNKFSCFPSVFLCKMFENILIECSVE